MPRLLFKQQENVCCFYRRKIRLYVSRSCSLKKDQFAEFSTNHYTNIVVVGGKGQTVQVYSTNFFTSIESQTHILHPKKQNNKKTK